MAFFQKPLNSVPIWFLTQTYCSHNLIPVEIIQLFPFPTFPQKLFFPANQTQISSPASNLPGLPILQHLDISVILPLPVACVESPNP